MMYARPELLHRILDVNAAAVTDYLNAQIEAGAQAVMIFDTWGGVLSARGLPRVLARLHGAHRAAGAHAQGRRPAPCRASSSPRAAASGWKRWPTPAPTRSASTGPPTSAKRASASATVWRCRATSIRWPCSARPSDPERGAARARPLRRGTGPCLQPRPRRLAAHAAGERAGAGRSGAHALAPGARRLSSVKKNISVDVIAYSHRLGVERCRQGLFASLSTIQDFLVRSIMCAVVHRRIARPARGRMRRSQSAAQRIHRLIHKLFRPLRKGSPRP